MAENSACHVANNTIQDHMMLNKPTILFTPISVMQLMVAPVRPE